MAFWEANRGAMKRDRESISCLRSVLMKPEHLEWADQIWEKLVAATEQVVG
jgi:hypothetical protein